MLAAKTTSLPELTAAEQALWLELIRQRCGLTFSDGRLRVLRLALHGRMMSRGLASCTDYYHAVSRGGNGDAEWLLLLDALLNKETSFFRHGPSFAVLRETILPELMRLRYPQGERCLHLWSAGCSTGQEAYSLAMAFAETAGARAWKARVTGSDLSLSNLERGRRGRYKPYEVRELPAVCGEKYLRALGDGTVEVDPALRAAVEFRPCNLLDADSYDLPPQDVIFCQNVLIYFAADDRRRIAHQLGASLRPGGCLFLGPAELVGTRLPGLEPLARNDVLVYRRNG